MTPQIKYTYFDIKGRGELVRLTAIVGQVPFEDDRITFPQWPTLKPTTPLGSLPVATIDGTPVVQTMALARFIAKLAGLYPTNFFDALLVDQVIETTSDFFTGLTTAHKGLEKAAIQSARETFVREGGRRYWGGCERIIGGMERGGPFVLGEEVSLADVAIAAVYVLMKSEILDFVPPDGLDGYEKMRGIFEAVMALPQVKEYHKKHPVPNMAA